MRFGLILDSIFAQHRNPTGHPESPERILFLIESLKRYEGHLDVVRFTPEAARLEWISRVHSSAHLERIQATQGKEGTYLDPDTQAGPQSYEVALQAAGSIVKMVRRLGAREIDAGFLAARPPGHHAESNRAMGFCLFNSIAVAAQWLIDQALARKVAIVDFDVHHGNGTQEIFYRRNDVLYVSTHQSPLYPGTGALSERGSGPGAGFTVNLPLRSGTGDAFYERVYADLVGPVLREFEPDLILVSAGYDAHEADPLAGMQMTSEGFATLVSILNAVAREVCDGRIVYLLEGGYDLSALAASVEATLETCLSGRGYVASGLRPPEFDSYESQVKELLSADWVSLRS
ncbi:MAG: histone deacetylase [Acidobacteriota bacterium]|nr:MAG: histone deacetylase [Acidobacteriota bacterium]